MFVDHLWPSLALIAGLVLLSFGGHMLVTGASSLALTFGVPSIVVGLTIVAIGTSTPELAVTFQALFRGNPDVGLGNVVGSGIFNILVILGIAAWLQPMTVAARLVRYEVPLMIAIAAGLWYLASDGQIFPREGLTLVIVFVMYVVWLIWEGRGEGPDFVESVEKERIPKVAGFLAGPMGAILCSIGGVIFLWIGSELAVSGAVDLSRLSGVPEVMVGLTVVAGGTGLPELATSIAAAVHRKADICVGNVVGSNILNVVAVLAPAALFSESGWTVHPQLLALDLPLLVGCSLLCLPVFHSGGRIDRAEASLFLLIYAGYLAVLVGEATQHSKPPLWTTAVYGYGVIAIAIVIATLWVFAGRKPKD